MLKIFFFFCFLNFFVYKCHYFKIFHSSLNNTSLKNQILLKIINITDVTTTLNEFLNEKKYQLNKFLNPVNKNDSFSFHFMSGSSVYISKTNQNILIERVLQCLGKSNGYNCHKFLRSFVIFSIWNQDWSKKLTVSKYLRINESLTNIYLDTSKSQAYRTSEGPEDARVSYQNNVLSINFNMRTKKSRQMFYKSFDVKGNELLSTSNAIQLSHSSNVQFRNEKNWVPIYIKDDLFYIYSFYPLRIIKCNQKNKNFSSCKVMFGGKPVDFKNPQTSKVRGGTNFVEISKGLFFSFARTRVSNLNDRYGFYRPNLVIISFSIDKSTNKYASPKLIFVSDPIMEMDDQIFNIIERKTKKANIRRILTPGSLSYTKFDKKDISDILISVNDDLNVVVRVEGLGTTVSKIYNVLKNQKLSEKLMVRQAEEKLVRYMRDYNNILNRTDY